MQETTDDLVQRFRAALTDAAERERDELAHIITTETPIAALFLAETWRVEKSHYQAQIEHYGAALSRVATADGNPQAIAAEALGTIPTPRLWDEARCRVCGWPLVERIEDGCVTGSCSMRPLPKQRADAGYEENAP